MMRKITLLTAWAALVALIVCFPALRAYLPTTNEGAAARYSDDWAGVLRLWVCDEMWQPGNGSFFPWLNACIRRFERRNPGVYVQASSVSLSVLSDFASGSINPPDLLLIAPGMLAGTEGLLAIEPSGALPEHLKQAGQGCATAVALGGYGWALNAAHLTEAPVDWAALGEAPAATKKNQRPFSWMDAPVDSAFSSYSNAFISLLIDREVPEEAAAPEKAGEGLSLGLPEDPQPTPTPRPLKRVRATLPSSLPADFRTRENVWSDFASGRTAASLLSQRELRRLEALDEAGRAPDWGFEAAPYTDQLAFLAIVDLPREDLLQRQALCQKLVDHFLSDESQKALTSIRAFRAVTGDALYARVLGFSQLERGLSQENVRVAAAFDTGFRSAAKNAADNLVSQSGGT